MKHTRLASPILTTAIALCLAAAATASASAPEFSPGTANPGTGDGSTVALETSATNPITCTGFTSGGAITGPKTVGGLVVTFRGCSSQEGSGCSLKTPGAAAGTIVTNTLDGELGSVKPAEAASGVGLLILPTTGTTFATLEGICLIASPAPVVGTFAAEVTPVNGVASKDGKVIPLGSKGVQKIKEINVLGTLLKPKLKALGLLEASDTGVGLALPTNAVTVT